MSVAYGRLKTLSPEELANKSIEAAIALDRMIRGESDESAPIKSLIDAVISLPAEEIDGQRLMRVADARTIDVFSRAVSSMPNQHPKTVDDLAGQIAIYWGAFETLSSVDDGGRLQGPQLSEIKSFCLALHREAMAELYDAWVVDRGESGGETLFGLR